MTKGVAISHHPRSYENGLLALLTFTYGVVFLDRAAMNLLAPFVLKDLELSNTQVGLLASGLSVCLAISAISMGRIVDRYRNHRTMLALGVAGFSLCSFGSGLAPGFAALLASRMALGLCEGPALPVSQALVAHASSPHRRGFNMGILQQFGSNLLGTFLAPVVMVWLALHFGWRRAFFFAGLPGLLCACAILYFVRAPTLAANSESDGDRDARPIMSNRNVVLCMGLGALCIASALNCFIFLPLYLTGPLGLSPTTMSWLMSVLGAAALLGGVVVPFLSDRFGRRSVGIASLVLSLVLPLGCIAAHGNIVMIGSALFIGFIGSGAAPIFLATIPIESVGWKSSATVVGMVMAAAEILGGVFGPLAGGVIADAFGLYATLWLEIAILIVQIGLSLALREPARAIITPQAC